jgi:hypothetical protein
MEVGGKRVEREWEERGKEDDVFLTTISQSGSSHTR